MVRPESGKNMETMVISSVADGVDAVQLGDAWLLLDRVGSCRGT